MYLPPPSIASILIGSEVRAPSPLMGEGRGEGEVRMAKVTPSSPLSPVPPHPRFKPGAGSSPLPRRGEGICIWRLPSIASSLMGEGKYVLPLP